jgi:phosphoadenosine phosphosulfate reductase
MQYLHDLQSAYENQPLHEALSFTSSLFPSSVKLSSSLSREDQVLTDTIARHKIPVNIFTIDTGRVFKETYDTLEMTNLRYGISIDVFFPEAKEVEQLIKKQGINGFYHSVEKRESCCQVRKVNPLNRALQGVTVWITGLRAEQTAHRKSLPIVEWLPDKKIYKINPLLHWTNDEVLAHISKYSVPYNPLHDSGFLSIGCAPCTRAVEPGEDPRTGRWWWENSHKECGLHFVK